MEMCGSENITIPLKPLAVVRFIAQFLDPRVKGSIIHWAGGWVEPGVGLEMLLKELNPETPSIQPIL